MKIATMLDILCFLLAMLIAACMFDALEAERLFYVPFILIFIGLIVFIQIKRRKL